MGRRPITFEGRVYKARPDRGPKNKDFTLDDLKQLATELVGTKVRYNHKDDKAVKDKRIGHIERAWIDDEEHLVVQGKIRGPNEIGEKLFEKIRDDLLSKRIPMLSMHWTGQAANPGASDDEKIAVPDTRWMKEISLVEQGFYPEANIISVAAAGDRTAWEVYASLLTAGFSSPSSVSTVVMEAPAQTAAAPAINAAHKHAALLKVIAETKASPDDMRKYEQDMATRDEAYSKLFGTTLERLAVTEGELGKYKQAEKRTRDEWTQKALQDAEKLAEKITPVWEDEGERNQLKEFITESAKDYDQKDRFTLMHKAFSQLADSKTQVAELRKMLPTPESMAEQEKRSGEVAMAASLIRNSEAKRQTAPAAVPAVVAGVNPTYIQNLLAALGNKI
jgi:hypothetical protein